MSQSLIRTTVITQGDEKTKSNQRRLAWYREGGLDVVLDTYERMGTLEKHNAFLANKPCMNMIKTYTGSWAVDHDTMEIVATTESSEDRMPITAVIEHGITGEVIFHSLQATSYLFRDNRDGSTTVLFVD